MTYFVCEAIPERARVYRVNVSLPAIIESQGDANGRLEAVIDWKSDAEMNHEKLAAYRTQLGDYRKQIPAL